MKKVLILEDEVSIRSFVVINLKRAGYDVVEAGTGEEALELLKSNPDVGVAILDIMLPGIDGFEVCRSIRATDKKIGIIMLTARSQEMDKITGLMTGADDYMTKPFSPAELTARIDALYRRVGPEAGGESTEITQGPFVLNTRNRGVCHHQTLHAEPRPRPVPRGHSGLGLGSGLRRRAEDCGRQHPAAAHQDRGRHGKSDVYHDGLGLRIQMGRLTARGK